MFAFHRNIESSNQKASNLREISTRHRFKWNFDKLSVWMKSWQINSLSIISLKRRIRVKFTQTIDWNHRYELVKRSNLSLISLIHRILLEILTNFRFESNHVATLISSETSSKHRFWVKFRQCIEFWKKFWQIVDLSQLS